MRIKVERKIGLFTGGENTAEIMVPTDGQVVCLTDCPSIIVDGRAFDLRSKDNSKVVVRRPHSFFVTQYSLIQ